VRQEPNAGLFWSLAFGIRRDRFEALGGFDEEFTGYGAEDTDFGFRAREAGTESLFMGGPGAFHQYHGVVDPPLHHFHDILRNAERFHKKWGRWPMEGWLKAFEALGLIVFTAERLTCLRAPDANDLLAARQSPPSRF
jgi:GT2 family glycosyltransferase